MECEEAWNRISARMDGEIADADRLALDSHLSICADCRAVAEAFQSQDSELRRAFVPRRKAAQAVAGRAIAEFRPASSWPRGRGLFLAVAAAAAGFVLAVILFQPWKQPPTDRQVADSVPAAPASVPTAEPKVSVIPIAQLAIATGLVETLVGEVWQPMATGGSIQAGSRVRTSQEAVCELRTIDGSEVRLNRGSEAAFQTNRSIELARGRMWSSVKKDKDPFEVTVPSAKVTALGTKFDLEIGQGSTVLTVVEGTTKVAGKSGVEYVGPGFSAKITADRIVRNREWDILSATSWVNKILVLKGPENPELSDRLLDLLAYIGEAKMKTLAESQLTELGESCVQPLLGYVQSGRSRFDRDRRVNAARIACRMATKSSVREIIQLLNDDSKEVRSSAAEALERLTGETQGLRADAWLREPASVTEPVYRKWLAWWEAQPTK